MATIKDVASAAGVSVTTVSHVFSGRRKVAPATADSVLAVAERLGYQPSGAAKALATGKSTVIALHLEMGEDALLLNPFFSELMMGFAASAADYGFTFRLLAHDLSVDVDPGSLGGAIVVDPSPQNPWVPHLARQGCRVVTIGRFMGGVDTSWVDNCHDAGMLAVIKHLAAQGFRRIALISVRQRMSAVVDIEHAFREGCSRDGLDGELLYAADLSDRAARLVAVDLLNRSTPPDAIVGLIDHMALGVLHAAQDLGIGVPDELGVVGFNDTVLSRHANPQLTTVRVVPEQLAREALRLMNEFWHNPDEPERHVRLPAELIVRASTDRS